MSGRRLISKAELLRWVDDDCADLDATATRILDKLARFADEECVGWATVETLAKAGRCSVRTAQYRLRVLEERGYIRPTGEAHRLSGSTRSVPKYLVGPLAAPPEPVENPASMGANPAPIEAHGCKPAPGMGATGCTQNNRDHNEASDEASHRAREAFGRLERAYPKAGLLLTDGPMAWRAFLDVVASGVDPEALVEAAKGYAASPVLKSLRSALVGLHRWLGEGRYRGTLPDADAPAEAPILRTEFAVPDAIREAVAHHAGEAFAGSYLGRAKWDPETNTITAATGVAFRALRETVAHIIEEHGAALAAPGGG